MSIQQDNDINTLAEPASNTGCFRWLIFILVWVWVAAVIAGRLASQILASAALTMIQDEYWLAFPLVEGFLLLLPLVPVAFLVRTDPWRSIYRTWLFTALYVLLLAPIAMVFSAAFQLQAVLNIVLSLLAAGILTAITRYRMARYAGEINQAETGPRSHNSTHSAQVALLVAALFGLPWVLIGALGSPIDTILGILSGLAFGVVSAVWLAYLVQGFKVPGYTPLRNMLFAGFSAGTALLISGSAVGYPFGGMQLLLVLCMPPLGWILMYLIQQSAATAIKEERRWKYSFQQLLPAALLAGLAAAFPLTFIDPDELALVIAASTGEILVWALAAAGLSAAVAWLSSLAAVIRGQTGARESDSRSTPSTQSVPRSIVPIATALAWLGLLVAFTLAGQPGFYGERMFVILHDQADLSSAGEYTDYAQRREYVFHTLVDHADRTQAPLRQDLARFRIAYTPYYLVNALEVRGGPLIRAWIANRPEVDRILDSPIMRPLPRTPPTAAGSLPRPEQPQWNLTQIGADRVWAELGVTGEGILIGQSDSGVQYNHPELADSYRGSSGDHNYSWYDPWYSTTAPVDIGGHGTHTLGSVLGDHTGVAPDAQWIACANLARNLGNPARYLDCMQFMLAPFPLNGDPFADGDPSRGADILNNSWGCPEIEGCDPLSLQPAVNALDAAGIFIVVSAGNDGPFCGSLSHPPANYQAVFTVGASDPEGVLAIFSSRGPLPDGDWVKPDITAPGVEVLSALPGSTYGVLSGTSMAGPHVAGTVALMWSANPELRGNTQRTREILNATARPLPGLVTSCPGAAEIPSTSSGYGLLDAYAAVQAATK